MKQAKVDVISIMWDKYVYIWFNSAVKNNDEGMKVLILKIRAISPDLKREVLEQYIG